MIRYSPSPDSSTVSSSASASSEPPTSGNLQLLADAARRARLHRPEAQVDAPVALVEPEPHAAVGEALGRRAGDRVGDQDRVGDPVDGEVAARRQRADDPGQHRARAARSDR